MENEQDFKCAFIECLCCYRKKIFRNSISYVKIAQSEESRWGKDELLESRSQMNRERTFTLEHQHKHVPRRLHSSELPSNSSQHPNISIGPFTKHWAWLQCSGSAPFPDADPDAGGGATLSDGHCSTTFYLDSLACSCCRRLALKEGKERVWIHKS